MGDFTRKNGESENELILRIGSKKDELGTWNDVANLLNELLMEHRDESTYRKKYRALENGMLVLEPKNDSVKKGSDEYEKILAEKESIRKERIKLQSLNLERNRIDRAEARQELFYEYVGQYIKTLPVPPVFEIPKFSEDDERQYVLCFGDIHYGAVFELENNAYDPETVVSRFNTMLEKTIKFVQDKDVSKITIINLGDNVQGLLRVSDAKLNDSSLVKSVVEVSRVIANFLNQLSSYVAIDYYHVPTSNHTQLRLLGVKPNEMPDEDVEYIISNYIKDLLGNNSRVNVHLANTDTQYILIDIKDYTVMAMHGHTVKNIDGLLDRVTSHYGGMIDYLFLGHYHSGIEMTTASGCTYDTEIIVCPSFIGEDPYASRILKSAQPAFKIFGFDDLYGHVETYKFIL